MQVKSVIILLFCAHHFEFITSAKILAIVPSPSYSHQIAFRRIWIELSERGHQITLITADPMNNPKFGNIKEIDISNTYNVLSKNNYTQLIKEYKTDFLKVLNAFGQIVVDVGVVVLNNPEVKALLENKGETFDLLMLEFINPIVVPFMYRFKAPTIALMSFDISYLGHDCIGNPTHPILYPDINLGLSADLNFMERVVSALFSVFGRYFMNSIIAKVEEQVAKHLGPDYPPILEEAKNIDMLFLNTNPIINQVRPSVPATIHLTGLHLEESDTLAEDLKKHLDDSKNGVIYFSLGTNVKSSTIDPQTLKTLLETFSELPYDVLFKFDADNLSHKPSNVVIKDWFPQQEILRHPNVKLFITQGGIQSMEEAVYSRKPMIGIPFMGEQESNVKLMAKKGVGLYVNHLSINKDEFKETILEVITNPKYKQKVEELAKLALDQPMTGVAKAIWWTEYVLRHKGAKHLKGPAVHLSWYQYYLLDVIGFCILMLVAVVVLIYITILLIKSCFQKLRFKKRKSE